MDSPSAGSPPRCTVCGGADLRPVIEIPRVPVHCNLLWERREEALAAPRGDIDLVFCPRCGHLFNRAFAPHLTAYSQAYENSLHYSPRFQAYADDLAHRLTERYGLRGKRVIEIGSGQGDFLRALIRLGVEQGIGFDPAYTPAPGDEDLGESLVVVPDFYSADHADRDADLIYSRHVLEHVEAPTEFLRAIRQAIGERRTPLFCEVPNALFILRDLSVWDVIYEHPSYFSPGSLAQAFRAAGFRVESLEEAFEAQFLWADGQPAPAAEPTPEGPRPRDLERFVGAFGAHYTERLATWRGRMAELAGASRRVVVWGVGSKGVTFLNALGPDAPIDCVVDINPRKEGMYVAGTGQRIIAPEALREVRPDVIIIMNPAYREEIGRQAEALGLECRILTG